MKTDKFNNFVTKSLRNCLWEHSRKRVHKNIDFFFFFYFEIEKLGSKNFLVFN